MLTVDGRPAPATGRLLDVCLGAGATVPHLCDDPHLAPAGLCRSCIVEVDGRCVAACSTPAREGTTVLTDTPRLRAYRRDLGELMHGESRPGLDTWGADGSRYPSRLQGIRDATHPYLSIDLDACILCRRCVRVCEEVQGQFVYAVEGRGAEAHLAWGGGAFSESPCVSCGACAATCPTGAITGERATGDSVRTTCGYCGVGCQLDVHVEEGRVTAIEGAEAEVNHGQLCVKGRYAHGFVDHPERLRTPLVRRDGRLVPATWEEAIQAVADGLRGRHVGGLSSARCTNEENYLFQKWLRAGLGTNDVDCCARVCHAPSAAGLRTAFGTGAATGSFDDIEHADLIVVTGANATEAHPVVGARVKQAVLRGATLIVIDPRKTELAALADVHLQLRPGTNVPLLNSLAATIAGEGLADLRFVERRTEGWGEYRAHILQHTPERWEEVTGVPAWQVRDAARRLAAAARPTLLHGLGMTEHLQGSEGVTLLCNLALLVGAVGRPGAGVNPLRGQNNVQGAADMGAQPDMLPGYQRVDDPAARERVEAVWGRPVSPAPGRTIPRMYDAIRAGALDALVILGEDVVRTDPDASAVRDALGRLAFLCVIELFPTETTALAHVVLPGASFLEKDGTFTNGERRVQRVRRVVPPVAGKADWEVLVALMAATGLPQPFRSPAEVLAEIASVAPPLAGVTWDRLDGDGLQWPVPDPDHPGTATLHAERFTRGLGKFSCVDWVPSPAFDAGLTLVTGRVLPHYNAGSMTRRSPNVELHDRDRLEIHPEDARAHDIADGDPVVIQSATGTARATAQVTDRVLPGTLFVSFHFPETGTNEVTGDVRDRVTDCPEYKLTAVTLRAGFARIPKGP